MNEFQSGELFDIYILETGKTLEKLEGLLLDAEEKGYGEKIVDEIFRLMHSMKGASASMGYDNVAKLCHAMEDIFHEIRENGGDKLDNSWITSMLLICKDFLSEELEKIVSNKEADGDSSKLVEEIRKQLEYISKTKKITIESSEKEELILEKWGQNGEHNLEGIKSYYAKIFFQSDSGMVNLRALILVQKISEIIYIKEHIPFQLTNEGSEEVILRKGFQMVFDTDLEIEMLKRIIADNATGIERLELSPLGEKEKTNSEEMNISERVEKTLSKTEEKSKNADVRADKGYLNVAVSKLDMLMDITSEIIVTESILVQNPNLKGAELQKFKKVARQFRKVTNELQDIVISLRMVPIAGVFQKMKRIVRDTSEKLGKKIELNLIGEGTEVDKNIVELIADPLMHIIRNSIDHGIEMPAERVVKGKSEIGKITLESRHVGSEVWIEIKDDGAGLNKEKIYSKAVEMGLTNKSINELKDIDIYNFIFQPGFSTKEKATEFSGRGVGMDVVYQNLDKLHGTASIEKTSSSGTTIALKIPLTLAIINGMIIRVGTVKYIVPVENIIEIIALKDKNIIIDTEGKEIINIRNKYYPMLRLHERFQVEDGKKVLTQGMTIIVQTSDMELCIFADELIGEQQVVVKALPEYMKKVRGIAGCSILGDGSISLIIDIDKLM